MPPPKTPPVEVPPRAPPLRKSCCSLCATVVRGLLLPSSVSVDKPSSKVNSPVKPVKALVWLRLGIVGSNGNGRLRLGVEKEDGASMLSWGWSYLGAQHCRLGPGFLEVKMMCCCGYVLCGSCSPQLVHQGGVMTFLQGTLPRYEWAIRMMQDAKRVDKPSGGSGALRGSERNSNRDREKRQVPG